MTTICDIESILASWRQRAEQEGLRLYTDGALAALSVAARTDGEVFYAAWKGAMALLAPLTRVDFGFRLLHPVGVFLVEESPVPLLSASFPAYLSCYKATGAAGGHYDTDYAFFLQSYATVLANRGVEAAVDIVSLFNLAVDASLGIAAGSTFTPPLLTDFIGARANVKFKIQVGALHATGMFDEDSWAELLRRRSQ